MKKDTKTNVLHALVSGKGWAFVQEVIDKHISNLSSVDDIDLEREDLRFELMVRKETKKRLEAIDAEFKSYNSQEKTVDPLNRSYK